MIHHPAALTQKKLVVEAVTQAELEAFLALKAQASLYNKQRLELVAFLEQGGRVEPGLIRVHLDPTPVQRLSRKSLTPLLGKEAVEDLLERVEPTIYRYLIFHKGRPSNTT